MRFGFITLDDEIAWLDVQIAVLKEEVRLLKERINTLECPTRLEAIDRLVLPARREDG